MTVASHDADPETATAETETAETETVETLTLIGDNIRRMRLEQNMTLEGLAKASGLSPSMLSLVERAKASPSIGSLVAITSALDIHMSDLMSKDPLIRSGPVSRRADQMIIERDGFSRRILRENIDAGVEISYYTISPGYGPLPAVTHRGFEHGLVIHGRLEVILDGRTYNLDVGDLISINSERPHALVNRGQDRVEAVWINVRGS